ncbi:hypothetical protein [Mesorhizobium comanense]|uniref:hypothetical protein n=1 Tax=Mesorhizobium comanense TaxID=2502215 RepID=UPI0010F82BB5|nr:hypothetical protein [Mesorhizobium comanense]
MALRRTARVTLAFLPLLVTIACVPQDNTPKAANKMAAPATLAPAASASGPVTDVSAPQPRTATYNCGADGMMTVENLGSSVHVQGPNGMNEDLQASPANQNSRYQQAHDAIVIDGREALVMKAGSTPVTCKR